jgi:hypothetical protein
VWRGGIGYRETLSDTDGSGSRDGLDSEILVLEGELPTQGLGHGRAQGRPHPTRFPFNGLRLPEHLEAQEYARGGGNTAKMELPAALEPDELPDGTGRGHTAGLEFAC